MFLPIGDTPNPKGFSAWANWGLVAVNVGVYLALTLPLSLAPVDPNDPLLLDYLRLIAPSLPQGTPVAAVVRELSAWDLFVFEHGYKPGAPEVSDLFASLFLHGGLLHLAGNMLFLWIYGNNVEHRLGRVGYLVVYLATGVAATLAFAWLSGPSLRPLVGASGAISGVLGLYFLLFPRNQVKVFVFLFPIFANTVLLPARWVLGAYVVLDNLVPLMGEAAGNVAYGAHLGGFAAGLVVAWLGERFAWRWPGQDRRWRAGARAARTTTDAPPGVDGVREALLEGDRAGAIARLANVSGSEAARLSPRESVELASWLEEAGHPVAATRLLRRCLAAHPQGRDLGRVYLALGLARLEQGQPTAAYQHLLAVFDHDPDPETEAAARAALAQIEVWLRRSR